MELKISDIKIEEELINVERIHFERDKSFYYGVVIYTFKTYMIQIYLEVESTFSVFVFKDNSLISYNISSPHYIHVSEINGSFIIEETIYN